MYAEWMRTVDPASEPLTLSEAKLQIRTPSGQTADDALLYSYIRTARETAEDYMARGLFTQTWQLNLGGFYTTMLLPMAAPLQSVTTVQYYDTTGTLQTLSSTIYDVDTISRPGRITLAANQAWPGLQSDKRVGRVIVTYVVGWTTIDLIPERIKQGIRFYLGYLTHDREGLDDGQRAVKNAQACWSDRVRWIEPRYELYQTWWSPDARWAP